MQTPKHPVELTWSIGAFSNEDLIERLESHINHLKMYGVNTSVGSASGVFTVAYYPKTKEEFQAELDAWMDQYKKPEAKEVSDAPVQDSYADTMAAGMWLFDKHKIKTNINRYNHFVLDIPGEEGQTVIETREAFITFAKGKGWVRDAKGVPMSAAHGPVGSPLLDVSDEEALAVCKWITENTEYVCRSTHDSWTIIRPECDKFDAQTILSNIDNNRLWQFAKDEGYEG